MKLLRAALYRLLPELTDEQAELMATIKFPCC